MRKKIVCTVLSIVVLSCSLSACGQTNQPIVPSKSSQVSEKSSSTTSVRSNSSLAEPEEIVEAFVNYTNDKYSYYDITTKSARYETIALSNKATVSGWNDGKTVQLSAAYVITAKGSDFNALVLAGTCDNEPKYIYLYKDDSGKLSTEDGFKATAFLPVNVLKKIQ